MRADLPGSLDLRKCGERVPEFCSGPFLRSDGKKEKWSCASGSRWRAARLDGISRRFPIARSALREPACNRSDQKFQGWCRSIPWCFYSVSFLPPEGALAQGSNSAHDWDAFRVAVSWSVLVLPKSFAVLFFRQPQAAGEHRSSAKLQGSATTPANFKFESL